MGKRKSKIEPKPGLEELREEYSDPNDPCKYEAILVFWSGKSRKNRPQYESLNAWNSLGERLEAEWGGAHPFKKKPDLLIGAVVGRDLEINQPKTTGPNVKGYTPYFMLLYKQTPKSESKLLVYELIKQEKKTGGYSYWIDLNDPSDSHKRKYWEESDNTKRETGAYTKLILGQIICEPDLIDEFQNTLRHINYSNYTLKYDVIFDSKNKRFFHLDDAEYIPSTIVVGRMVPEISSSKYDPYEKSEVK